jgi:hypothetical protein
MHVHVVVEDSREGRRHVLTGESWKINFVHNRDVRYTLASYYIS